MKRPRDFDLSRPLDRGGPRLYLPPLDVILRELEGDEAVSRWDWEDKGAERRELDPEDEDRTLTGDRPPGLDGRCFGSDEL